MAQKREKSNSEPEVVDIDYQIEEAEKIDQTSKSKGKDEIASKTTLSSENEALKEIKQLYEKLEEKETEYTKLYDRYLRALADYENLEKRNRNEFSRLTKQGNRKLLLKLMDLADSFERANATLFSVSTTEEKILVDGFKAVFTHFDSILKNEGVTRINAVGKPFDPNYHEAVYTKKDDNVDEDIIIEEVQAGYMLNDELLRPTKVVIAKKE